jgi:putative DNA primase/helicase
MLKENATDNSPESVTPVDYTPHDAAADRPPDPHVGDNDTLDSHPHTDYGNAERLTSLYGRDMLYVPKVGWHTYTGKRWEPNEDGAVERFAKKTLRQTHAAAKQAEEQLTELGDARTVDQEMQLVMAGKLAAWCRKSESRSALSAMVTLAQTELKVVVDLDDLDADPYLLNVANGTVDLRTGDLLVPDRSHRITKLSPVTYDPNATNSAWSGVLAWLDQGYDGTLAEYLRIMCGYSLTASIQEDVVHLLDGPGGTSKSTFMEPVRVAAGEYGAVAQFDMFVQRKGDQAHPTDLARLVGRRIVTAEEGPKNRNLDAAKIKNLTGGTKITARFMRQDFFEYDPILKLWLVTNYRPKVHSEDTAAWRRLRAVPFTHVVPPELRDTRLREYLRTDPGAQTAILAWLVSGARDWYQRAAQVGKLIDAPECVLTRTTEWRRDADRIGAWLEDECELDPSAWTSSTALQTSINTWWKTFVSEHDWQPPSLMGALGDELRARGCTTAKNAADVRGWSGIRLRRLPSPFAE